MGNTRGWTRVEKLSYNTQPIYVNTHNGELAFESFAADGRLVSLPTGVETVIRVQLV
jgi:hypothetical protein